MVHFADGYLMLFRVCCRVRENTHSRLTRHTYVFTDKYVGGNVLQRDGSHPFAPGKFLNSACLGHGPPSHSSLFTHDGASNAYLL
jgi:hypothetical protein